MDLAGEAYRLHPLFRDFLLASLEADGRKAEPTAPPPWHSKDWSATKKPSTSGWRPAIRIGPGPTWRQWLPCLSRKAVWARSESGWIGCPTPLPLASPNSCRPEGMPPDSFRASTRRSGGTAAPLTPPKINPPSGVWRWPAKRRSTSIPCGPAMPKRCLPRPSCSRPTRLQGRISCACRPRIP